MGTVRTFLSNERRSARIRYEKASAVIDDVPDPASRAGAAPARPPPTPQARTRSRDAQADEALTRMRSALQGDTEALAVVELSLTGVDKPAEQAARLNMPVTRVYDAKDRINRCMRRIGRELASRQKEEEVAQ